MSVRADTALAALKKGVAAFEADPRFAMAWTLAPSGRPERPLLIAIHGSLRDHLETRDAFDDLAIRADINVLAPLFPAGAVTPDYADGYKFLREADIDYAALLEEMLAAFTARHMLLPKDVYLFGFSGGAQFALRYAYVAAARLSGVVIAAPGSVTLFDAALPWWPGLAGIEKAVGRPVDAQGLKTLPVHLIIGGEDQNEGLVMRGPDHPNYSPFSEIAGTDRRQRIEALRKSLEKAGLRPGFEVLEGVCHELTPIAGAAAAAIAKWLGNAKQ